MSLDAIAQQNGTDRRGRGKGRGGRRGRGGIGKRDSSSRPSRSEDTWKHDLFDKDPESRRGPRSSASTGNGLANRVIVENLHYEVTQDELESLFGQIGPMKKAVLKFDKSGRSLGIAEVTYEDPMDATRAKREFDGALAKGQNITVAYDPTSRPQATDLLDRMGVKVSSSRRDDRGPRNRDGDRRGRGRGRGGSGGGGRPEKQRRKPVTQEDLDRELEGYMKGETAETSETASTQQIQNGNGAAATTEDAMDMS